MCKTFSTVASYFWEGGRKYFCSRARRELSRCATGLGVSCPIVQPGKVIVTRLCNRMVVRVSGYQVAQRVGTPRKAAAQPDVPERNRDPVAQQGYQVGYRYGTNKSTERLVNSA